MMRWPHAYIILLLLYSFVQRAQTLATKVTRYRARVAYDGSGFKGFQLQSPGKRTVQGCLEETLSLRLNQPVRIVAAGRTDAGVHARGQAIHFDLKERLEDGLDAVQVSLNRLLPIEIRLWNLQPAPLPTLKTLVDKETNETFEKTLNWNVLYDSTKKLYSYRLSLAPVMDPLERHHRWHPEAQFGRPIDPIELARILKHYQGEHDFRAFAGSIEQLEKKSDRPVSTVRTVYKVDLVDEEKGNYRIDVLLKGALYKQVRSMVGTALDVCRRSVTEQEFLNLLQGGENRSRAQNKSKPAPPEGLTLEHVYFDDEGF